MLYCLTTYLFYYMRYKLWHCCMRDRKWVSDMKCIVGNLLFAHLLKSHKNLKSYERALRFARFIFAKTIMHWVHHQSTDITTKVQIFMDNLFCFKTIQIGQNAIFASLQQRFGDSAKITTACQQSWWWSRPRSPAVTERARELRLMQEQKIHHKCSGQNFSSQWNNMRTLLCNVVPRVR